MESYQGSNEPGKPQESDFWPKTSESSATNVQEHCRDGCVNFLLATNLVSCDAQNHVGDGGDPCSTIW